MISLISYKENHYPFFQSEGNAAQFAIPYAQKVCFGLGYDVGCMKAEWAFPGSVPVDLSFDDPWEAMNLPPEDPDYIFSSHCLEHIPDWVEVMNYWHKRLKLGGTLFLYLPDYSQEYWRPWNNRKHYHIFSPKIIADYLKQQNYQKYYVSETDLNYSFMAMAEK
jgi:predicted SAM-dependent methyltransferase